MLVCLNSENKWFSKIEGARFYLRKEKRFSQIIFIEISKTNTDNKFSIHMHDFSVGGWLIFTDSSFLFDLEYKTNIPNIVGCDWIGITTIPGF